MSSKPKTNSVTGDGGPELVPKLRFPAFQSTHGWDSAALNELAIRVTTRNSDAIVTRVLTNSAEFGILDQRDYFDRDIATAGKLDTYFVVERGDFVYNPRTSSAAPVGPISRNNLDRGVMSPLYTVFRFKEHDTDFFAQYFRSSGWHPFLRRASSTGARHDRMSITPGVFMQMSVPFPSPDERHRIADCLNSMDDLIAAQGRKLKALQAHKRGLMQYLFPEEGNTLPRFRFPEFRDGPKWRTAPLGEAADFQSGGTPSKSIAAFWNGTIPWVSAKDMKHLFLDDTEEHITDEAIADGAKLVPPGTILILTRGMTLLKDVPICSPLRPMSFNQDVRALRPRDVCDGRYLAFLLISRRKRLMRLVDVAGHGTGRLDTDKLKAMDVSIPRLDEQMRIADCLGSLDATIASADAAVEFLKTHKNGLMQALFPATQEVRA